MGNSKVPWPLKGSPGLKIGRLKIKICYFFSDCRRNRIVFLLIHLLYFYQYPQHIFPHPTPACSVNGSWDIKYPPLGEWNVNPCLQQAPAANCERASAIRMNQVSRWRSWLGMLINPHTTLQRKIQPQYFYEPRSLHSLTIKEVCWFSLSKSWQLGPHK